MTGHSAQSKDLMKPLLYSSKKIEEKADLHFNSSLVVAAEEVSTRDKFNRMNTVGGLPKTVEFEFEDNEQEDAFAMLGASADGFLNP